METPFSAYKGEEGYVFVCYSHANMEEVYEDISRLNDRGLRIWYDEGISPGTEWSEELGNALSNARLVLFYASSRSAQSRHCRDEINFAHNHDIPVLAIHLEDVELPVGLELSLSSTQAIKKYALSDENYLGKLTEVLPREAFGGVNQATDSRGTGPVKTQGSTKRRHKPALAGIAVLVLVLGGMFVSDPDYWIARWIMFSSDYLGSPIEQDIAFATTEDDVRIAYATTGEGPPVVIVLGWATHLQEGMNSPAYDPQGVLAMSSEKNTVIRYDGRGFGLSDREVSDYSLESRVRDIEAVVEAAGLDRFALYAMSAGGMAGITYAHRHPEKVTSLVLASTMARGDYANEEDLTRWRQMLDLFESSWDSPAVVNLMLDFVFSDVEGVEAEILNEFFRRSARGDAIAGFLANQIDMDVRHLAKQLKVPTLVIHGRDDATIPLEEGRLLASLIPDARFEIVEGGHGPGCGFTPDSRRQILDFVNEVGFE